VLVVDDNLDTVHSMAMLLRDSGHQVQFAINGIAALHVAEKFRPEVIFLDLGLPDGDGVSLVRKIRRSPELKTARVIAITGKGEAHRSRALDAGCDEFLVKPVDPQLLDELVEK
jgi:DNA-binding response OmpR family regulator